MNLAPRKSIFVIFAISVLLLDADSPTVSLYAAGFQEASPKFEKSQPSKQSSDSKQLSPEQELQGAVNNAGSDRVALIHNLEAYLAKYPESPQRPRIYRALVEACMQSRDTARATDYAERLVALSPDDMSITLLAVQLLERNGDEAGLRRAVNYSTRVLDYVTRSSSNEKSPRVSQEEWAAGKKRDQSAILLLRGRLELKLKENDAAEKDFEESYAVLPSAAAAEKIAEVAELKKDWNRAIAQYARAFALGDDTAGSPSRREVRQKLGNVWRLAHGSEDGLGEYLLRTYDEVTQSLQTVKHAKNSGAHEPSEFVLRKIPEGSPFPLAATKGKVVVVNFWATWCGPCHALAPLFANVSNQFAGNADAVFLAADCDEDESLVPPYLAEEKPRTTVVFADGLNRLFDVTAFPTVIVIDRAGKVAYRSEGFGEESFEQDLTAAVRRALTPAGVTTSTPAATP